MNVAIIGCGERGAAYAAAAHRCGLTVSVCADVSERRAHKLARVHHAAATKRCKMALRSKDVDAAIVTTPTPAHAEYVLSALRAGRPVLCEAPFTRNVAQAREIVREERKTGVVCHVAYASMFRHEYEAIEAQINAKKIEKVGYIRTYRTGSMPKGAGSWYRDYTQSGGVTLDRLVNDFDWISREFGKVKKVFCRNLEHRDFDFSMVTLTLETAVLAQVIGSWAHAEASPPTLKVEICGTGGMIQFNSDEIPVRLLRRSGEARPNTSSPMTKGREDIEIERFIAAANGSGKSMSAENALQAMRVAEAALTSAKTGKAVRP